MNGINSPIFLSDLPLLEYRNEKDLSLFIFYPTTLLNSLIISSNFLILSSGFSMYSIRSSAHSEAFVSFPIWIALITLTSLITIGRIFRDTLNHRGESENPCLVPDLRRKAFSFSPLRIMFAVGLSYMAFCCLVGFLISPFMKNFNHKWMPNCSKAYSLFY